MSQKQDFVTRQIILPQEATYSEWLRFICQTVQSPNDPSFPFLVRMWHSSIENNGLYEDQQKHVEPYIKAAKEYIDHYFGRHKKEEITEEDWPDNVEKLFKDQ